MSRNLLAQLDQPRVVAAIRDAEARTSGEIKVHVEESAGSDIAAAALARFRALGLERTAARNAVLVFIAARERRFRILADAGIDGLVGRGFWDAVAESLARDFAAGRFSDGLVAAIDAIGAELERYFPWSGPADVNELSDAISHGAPERVAIALGANLGRPAITLGHAIDALARVVHIDRVSSLYESEPLASGGKQPWFTNAVVTGTTLLSPAELLSYGKRLEYESGRDPQNWHGPRELDVDLLLFGDRVENTADLALPHPGLLERRFTLEPLAEIAPGWVHPVSKRTLGEEAATRQLAGRQRKLKTSWR